MDGLVVTFQDNGLGRVAAAGVSWRARRRSTQVAGEKEAAEKGLLSSERGESPR
jgi:hypothetical protein